MKKTCLLIIVILYVYRPNMCLPFVRKIYLKFVYIYEASNQLICPLFTYYKWCLCVLFYEKHTHNNRHHIIFAEFKHIQHRQCTIWARYCHQTTFTLTMHILLVELLFSMTMSFQWFYFFHQRLCVSLFYVVIFLLLFRFEPFSCQLLHTIFNIVTLQIQKFSSAVIRSVTNRHNEYDFILILYLSKMNMPVGRPLAMLIE